MYSIEILGAFHFIPQEITIGILEYERIKGNASFRFSYNPEFLSKFPELTISADIGRYLGVQATSCNLFSFLGDALPDRWGKALIDKKERIEANEKKTIPRTFDDFGYLVRIDDFSRMGALRFKYNGNYIGLNDGKLNIPPITSLDSFIREAQMIEKAERENTPYQKEWIDNVWKPGSSLGGARPKLNIIDNDGNLLIAKIPSIYDNYDIALWEHFACKLAKTAGINIAQTSLLRIGPSPYHTLLSKRFDRDKAKRIHFASSLTLTKLKDGDNAQNGKGYIDIIDAMAGNIGISSLSKNTAELFRRIVFNILIGNHDDHFRNHGFLLGQNGWELSPAYDLNPTNYKNQVLAITPYTNESSIKELYESAEYYLLTQKEAAEIIEEVTAAVEKWRQIANNLQIPAMEQTRFAERFKWGISSSRIILPKKATIIVTNKSKGKGGVTF